jgi:hypothetical protein
VYIHVFLHHSHSSLVIQWYRLTVVRNQATTFVSLSALHMYSSSSLVRRNTWVRSLTPLSFGCPNRYLPIRSSQNIRYVSHNDPHWYHGGFLTNHGGWTIRGKSTSTLVLFHLVECWGFSRLEIFAPIRKINVESVEITTGHLPLTCIVFSIALIRRCYLYRSDLLGPPTTVALSSNGSSVYP